ncbi:DUF4829 domain-containing protein [Clostridium sp. 19966]|uniref:DUF4829 domain-containing protein n=1 Tax=Clostridium sp. 19966 TaxID=2768166 RepID=UPI0028DF3BC1|nr:DUF4829 domain-containing protein [Clostridium sp. 19966]MDT8718501.1 DUF4829 domain-containing protein [Clostridium sp. 19966]
MKKNHALKIGIILIVFSLIYVFINMYLNSKKTPENTIRIFYKYMNEKNSSQINKYTYGNFNISKSQLDNLENIEIISIKESDENTLKSGYLQEHKDTKLLKEDIKVLLVKYHAKYKDDSKEPIPSGEFSTNYLLIRVSDGSSFSWKISESGW